MTTAAKRDSDAKAIFRRFTDSLVELLEHPETPTEVHNALVDAVAGINNATQAASAPKDFDRLVLERVFGLGAEGRGRPAGERESRAADRRGLPRETVGRLQALGSAIADVLEDDATPTWLYEALTDVTLDADNRASGGGGDRTRRAAVQARRLFAETVLIAEEGGDDDGNDE